MGGWNLLVNANDSQWNVVQTLVGVSTPEPVTYLLLVSFLGIILLVKSHRKNQTIKS